MSALEVTVSRNRAIQIGVYLLTSQIYVNDDDDDDDDNENMHLTVL